MSVNTAKCPYLNDRVVRGEVIGPDCSCGDASNCPHIRSMKKAIGPQCWRIKAKLAEGIIKKMNK